MTTPQNPATNVFTRQNFGAPPSAQGKLGLFLPRRKLLSGIYLPSRWERAKIRGWVPYMLSIPSIGNGLWSLAAQDTQQFSATCPVYFAVTGFLTWSNLSAGAQITLYDVNAQHALINPSGPDLLATLLGGNAKNPFWLKEFFFLDPGDTLLADITNLSMSAQIGQVVAFGNMPLFPGVLNHISNK